MNFGNGQIDKSIEPASSWLVLDLLERVNNKARASVQAEEIPSPDLGLDLPPIFIELPSGKRSFA